MTKQNKKELLAILASAIFIFMLLALSVFMSGGTFGQRCAEHYIKKTAEWHACTYRLARGENP